MAKLSLTDITSGYSSSSTQNANNTAVEAALENTLSRDGTSPNTMEAQLDMNGYALVNLPDAVNNQSPVTLAQAASIASVSTAFTQENVGAVLYPKTAAETSAAATIVNYYHPPGNVLRYGTNSSPGTTNMSTAVQAAFDVVDAMGGGRVWFDPEVYLLSTEVLGLLTQSGNYSTIIVEGNGAIIKTSGAIAGLVLQGGGTLGNIIVRDLKVDHRGNANATAGLVASGAQHIIFDNCKVVAGNGTGASYACFKVTQSALADSSTGSFWARLIDCETRVLSGGDTKYQYGVLVEGSCNDTHIIRGKYTGAEEAIRSLHNATSNNVPNGLKIEGVALETNTYHIRNVGSTGLSGYIGPQIRGNRFESGTHIYSESGYDTASATPGKLAGNRYISGAGSITLIASPLITTVDEEVITPDLNVINQHYSRLGKRFTSTEAPVQQLVPGAGAGSNVTEWMDNSAAAHRAAMYYITGSQYMLTSTQISSGLTLAGIRAISSTASRQGNNLSGSVTLSSGTAAVSFGTAEPNANYRIYLSGSAAETFRWATKATTGFTINSSNGASTANVDWLIIGN